MPKIEEEEKKPDENQDLSKSKTTVRPQSRNHFPNEADKTLLYQTALDITQDVGVPTSETGQDEDREKQWQTTFKKQQSKIKQQRAKIVKIENELKHQRKENEQTFEMLTQLCNDLKFRHEEDVDELNSEIEMLKSIL